MTCSIAAVLALSTALFAALPASAEETIEVLNAVYGTPGTGRTCDATAVIRAACDGKTSCDVLVSNRLCGDPDFGTPKTLNLDYQCGPAVAKSLTAPELTAAHLSCDPG